MPRTTNLFSYPPEFEALLRRASEQHIDLEFPTSARRTKFRHRFYAYMKAVRETDQLPELRTAARLVSIVPSEQGLWLKIGPSCATWEGELLREQLKLEPLPAKEGVQPLAQLDVSSSQDKLRAKLAEIRATKALNGASEK